MVVGRGGLKKMERTFHVSVPVTISSVLFSIEAVSVTGFCCAIMSSLDMTETRAIRFCPKEVSPSRKKGSVRRQTIVNFVYVENKIVTFSLLCSAIRNAA